MHSTKGIKCQGLRILARKAGGNPKPVVDDAAVGIVPAINEIYQLELYEIQDELRKRGYSPKPNHLPSNGNINPNVNPKLLKPDSNS